MTSLQAVLYWIIAGSLIVFVGVTTADMGRYRIDIDWLIFSVVAAFLGCVALLVWTFIA